MTLRRTFVSGGSTSEAASASAAASTTAAPAATAATAGRAVYAGLAGQVALVTGGSSGIGFAVAQLLLEQGATVAVTSRSLHRAQHAIAALAAILPEAASRVLAVEADSRSSVSVDAAVEAVWREFGQRLDLLVHAAGVSHDALLVRASDAHIEDTLQTNLSGAIYASRAAARKMMQRRTPLKPTGAAANDGSSAASTSAYSGGCMVFIGSIIGQRGAAGQSVYAASKAGLHGLTSSLSSELSSRSIRVHCVCPGYISTAMTARLSAAARAALVERVPSKRMGRAEEVAHLVAFLASSNATYITGQIIAVDGGIQ